MHIANKAQIRQIVADALNIEPLTVEFAGSGMSETYVATLHASRDIIVRTNIDPSVFATTQANVETLRRLGLPVPTVLACDTTTDRYPFAYMLLEAIPGRDLRYELAAMSQRQMTVLAEHLVGFQRLVETLPLGGGFGYAGIGSTARFESWWDLLQDDLRETKPPDELARQVHDIFRVHERYLRAVQPACFLDDITVKNVIIQDGGLQGLIDFDCVCYGDPLWWIGLTAAGVVSDVGIAELFYVDEICRFYGLTDEQQSVLALYSAMHACRIVAQSTGNDAEWPRRMEAQIGQWLAGASTT